MNRNLIFSKETEDKVKLAKKYIQDKYQNIIHKEKVKQRNWEKLITEMVKFKLNENQKLQIASKTIQQQSIMKRLARQPDSLNSYQLYGIIGRGAFGQVRLAKSLLNDKIVAIKRLEKKKIAKKRQIYNAYLQRDFMIKNKSKFLVNLYSTFQDQDYLYMVMEYVPGGDLLHLLIEKDILTQQQTRFYIGEMILAVEEIHKMGYIHRDIKPDNILLDQRGHVKVSDFGLSKYLQGAERISNRYPLTKINQIKKLMMIKGKHKSYSKVGTPDYISPEVLTQNTYDQSIDIWGIGVVMFECLFGYPPFSHDDSKEVCNRVVNWLQYLQFPNEIDVSVEAKMLILGMMNQRKSRLSIKQIKMHPFFKGFDWKNIRQLHAPIIPQLKDEIDTNNFDKFEEENPWIYRSNEERKTHHRCRASSTQIPNYNFVGFNYRQVLNEVDIFKKAQRRIKNLIISKSKERSKDRSPQSIQSIKRIKTDISQKQLNPNFLRSTKMRGSVAVGKENKQKQLTSAAISRAIKKKSSKFI